jgi:short subunit fatty acids transporter
MSDYNSKNYMEQGGEKWVIGGTLVIQPGASVTGLPAAENQVDSTATDTAGLVTDFNALLAKLKAAGLMVADEE